MRACTKQSRLARGASSTLLAIWGLGALTAPACQPTDTNLYLAAGGRVKLVLSDANSAKLTEAIDHFLASRLNSNPATRVDQLISVDVRDVRFRTYRSAAGITATRKARVFRRTFPGGDRSIGAPVSCRVRPKGTTWAVVSCRVGQTEFGPGSRIMRPSSPDHGSTGIVSCDTLEAYLQCYAKKLPTAPGAAMLKVWRATVRGYRKSLKDPANRLEIAKRCQRGVEQIRGNVPRFPRLKDCVR